MPRTVPLGQPTVGEPELAAVAEVFASGWLSGAGPTCLAFERFAGADEPDHRPRERLRNLGARDDHGPAAVAHHAAIQAVQRIGNHRRGQYVVDGDPVAQHRVRVVLRVVRGGHLDPGDLFGRRAEFVHVPASY